MDRNATVPDGVITLLDEWLDTPAPDTLVETEADPVIERDTELDRDDAGAEDQHDVVQDSLLWGAGAWTIVPGGDYPVLEGLIRIRLAREEYDEIDRMLLDYLRRDRDAQIWDRVLLLLLAHYPADPIRKAAIFGQIFATVPQLIGSKAAAYLVANAYLWSPDFADAQLELWRGSGHRLTRQAYGEMVAVTCLMRPDMAWAQTRLAALIEDYALSDARAGAALSAANLWNNIGYRRRATDLLTRLLDTGGDGVWKASFEVFRLAGEFRPNTDTISLLTTIDERLRHAPRLDATFVVECLATLLPHEAPLVGRVAEGLIGNWKTELADISTRTAAAAPQLVDLAVTLHRLGPETSEVGTQLFEELIGVNAWEAHQTLSEIDNRFLAQAPRRPRLRRRNRPRRRATDQADS